MIDKSAPLLELRGLTKSFAGVRVLSSIDLAIRPGEIHALIGQNGSGKSTIIKILSGYHAPDGGEVLMRGEPVPLPMRPGQSVRWGLRFLHQDVGVARTMTVLENLRVGRFRTTAYGRLRWGEERRAARATLAEMQIDLDPDTLVRDVPPAERALIGFMRAIQEMDHERGEVLILDEPTAFLPAPSVEKIFKAVRNVAQRGSAVVFVSHRLDEILDIADRTSILRDGRLIETVVTKETTQSKLVAAMLGRELDSLYPKRSVTRGQSVLGVDNLTGRIARGVSFAVHKGEIVGLTGLLGMGHDEIPYLLFGATKGAVGTVTVADKPLADLTPDHAIAARVAFLPADRHRQSGIPKATVLENVTMANGSRFMRHGFLQHRAERTSIQQLLERFDVRPASPDRLLATLSGGNQQKALLGKWLQTHPAVLLLHEPTQGVDIGSRQQILKVIAEVAASGAAVVMASSEYDELAHLCHRVLVFRHGRVVRELTGDDLTEARIAEQCYLADSLAVQPGSARR